ncbi:MAG: hypothetical protein KC657_24195 [Myxococcales bacterium]|nr:hypothetical protein [Myxococcales bacterium]
MIALSWVLVVALAAHFGSHVAVSVALARKAKWYLGLVAFLVPPLAPYWAFKAGLRPLGLAWLGSLAAYAAGVAAARAAL